MKRVVRAAQRGSTDVGWLKSAHTFSFGDYFNPEAMGWRSLRVINDDVVAAGQGFGTHPHRDMEIVSYVVEGALEHKDSLGNGGVIRPGDVQRMSAGTGVHHSESNGSKTDPVRFLQIWILPAERGLPPSYEQKHFPVAARRNTLRAVASPDGREGAVTVHQDATLYAAVLDPGARVEHVLPRGRYAWIQVVQGELSAEGVALARGDGMALAEEEAVRIEARSAAEVLVFDLA